MLRSTFAKLLIRGFALFAALAAMGTAALLALLWREHRTELRLPAPTGHFAVGRTTYAWVNDAQTDELSPKRGAKREVLVWIWYPSAPSPSARPADYLPLAWRTALARIWRENWMGVLMSDLFDRDPSLVHAHSASDPGVSEEAPSYPVVIMRAGLGALTTDYTTLAEDLASHGYIVAGLDAPYRTGAVVFPDGRVVTRPPAYNPGNWEGADQERLINKLLAMWVSDAQFVVDQLDHLNSSDPSGRLAGRMDMKRLGFFGHSFGGAQAAQFCHDDSRCKAGIDLDGAPFGSVVHESLAQPFMFLLSDHSHDDSSVEGRKVGADIASIYDRLPNGRWLLMIRGANHFSFSDQILLKSRYIVRPLLLLTRGIDERRGLRITTEWVHTFFDVYLKHAPASLFENLRRAFPEVQPIAGLR